MPDCAPNQAPPFPLKLTLLPFVLDPRKFVGFLGCTGVCVIGVGFVGFLGCTGVCVIGVGFVGLFGLHRCVFFALCGAGQSWWAFWAAQVCVLSGVVPFVISVFFRGCVCVVVLSGCVRLGLCLWDGRSCCVCSPGFCGGRGVWGVVFPLGVDLCLCLRVVGCAGCFCLRGTRVSASCLFPRCWGC
jgi:hypothetical protein